MMTATDISIIRAEGLARDFFSPIRKELEAASTAFTKLWSRQVAVRSVDLLPTTDFDSLVDGRPSSVTVVVLRYIDDDGPGTFVLKCTNTESHLGRCPDLSVRRRGSLTNATTEAPGDRLEAVPCKHHRICPHLAETVRTSGVVALAAAPGCPFGGGMFDVMRGHLLAVALSSEPAIDPVSFGLLYDERNGRLANRLRTWKLRAGLSTWTYQDLMSGLPTSWSPRIAKWHALLRSRYGLVAAPRAAGYDQAGRQGNHRSGLGPRRAPCSADPGIVKSSLLSRLRASA